MRASSRTGRNGVERSGGGRPARGGDAELARARADAARLARAAAVGDLVATTACDLSHPLAAIRHDAEAALRSLAEGRPARAREAVEGILAAASRASEVVRDVRRAAGRGGGERRPIALEALAADAIRLVAAEADARGVAVALDAPRHLPRVAGHAADLRSVVAHLAASAVECAALGATRRAATVRVVVRERGEDVRLEVVDGGPAPAAEDVAALGPFAPGGARAGGMGLALCRAIAEAHGGSLTVDRDGAGARAALTLPAIARARERT